MNSWFPPDSIIVARDAVTKVRRKHHRPIVLRHGEPSPINPSTARILTRFNVIARCVALVVGIHQRDILSDSRAKPLTRARQMIAHLARRHTPLSLTQIGKHIHRDHASTLHACRMVDGFLASDAHFREYYEAAERSVLAIFAGREGRGAELISKPSEPPPEPMQPVAAPEPIPTPRRAWSCPPPPRKATRVIPRRATRRRDVTADLMGDPSCRNGASVRAGIRSNGMGVWE